MIIFFITKYIVIFMKVLIVYFSKSGHTKKVAELIASSLDNENVEIQEISYSGKVNDIFLAKDAIQNGDLSKFTYDPKILDVKPFDLVCIGVPTYGFQPCLVFDGYMKAVKNIENKSIVTFGTCAGIPGKTKSVEKMRIEGRKAKVLDQIVFKRMFGIKSKTIAAFCEQFKQKLKSI
jgi:flavodoxin